MALPRTSQLWPTSTSLLLGSKILVVCLLVVVATITAEAFVVTESFSFSRARKISPLCFGNEPIDRLSVSKRQKQQDQYYTSSAPFSTSTTTTRRRVTASDLADHVHSMYSDGTNYRKTLRRKRSNRHHHSTPKTNNEVVPAKSSTTATATIPTNELINQLNRYPSLILNADYQPMSYLPLSVCHWQEAVKSVFCGKVTVVDVYEGVMIRAANLEIPLPSVIALNEYVPLSSKSCKPAFTRRNVFLRDEYTCQYCSNLFHTRDLSIDHVVPRSMGGRLNWENAVTSCLKCNGRKGNMLVRDLKSVGMRLRAQPRVPSRQELAVKAGKMIPRKVHPTWQPYLGLAAEREDGEDDGASDLDALGIRYHDDHDDHNDPPATSSKTTASKKKKPKKAKKLPKIMVEQEEMQNARRR